MRGTSRFVRCAVHLSLLCRSLCYTPAGYSRYVARVMYDGTNYNGFQTQNPGSRTIQGTLTAALRKRLGDISTTGASRTDSGVHARGNCIHFDAPTITSEELQSVEQSVNQMLPSDIRIFNTRIAPIRDADDTSGLPLVFHATGSSTGKLYSYRFCRNPYVDPTKRLYCSHFFYNFDLALFDQCLQQFVGTHDFVSFANKVEKTRGQYKGHGIELNTIKTVDKIDLIDEGNGYYVINIRVQSALNRMLRNIVGASLHVAEGNMPTRTISFLTLWVYDVCGGMEDWLGDAPYFVLRGALLQLCDFVACQCV